MRGKRYDGEDGAEGAAGALSLYERYGGVIFDYLRRHTRSREDAEDVTFEVFVAALEKQDLAHIPVEEQIAWLKRVAYHKLVDLYRSSMGQSFVQLEQVAESLLAAEEQVPEQVVLQHEAYGHLHQMVRSLPVVQQRLLHLRYGDGLRFAEIAALLNKREASVRKLLSRTLATLRTLYQQSVEEKGDTYER